MVNFSNLIIKMSPRFVLGRENVPCVAEVVNRSVKADCTDFTDLFCVVCIGLLSAEFSTVDTELGRPMFWKPLRLLSTPEGLVTTNYQLT